MTNVKLIGYNILTKFIVMLFFYLQDIALARFLGTEGYAEWAYFFSIISALAWISNLGVNNAIQTTVAQDAGDSADIYNHLISGTLLRCVVSGLFIGLYGLLIYPICTYSGLGLKYKHLMGLLFIGMLYLFFYLMVEFIKSAVTGLKRTDQLLIISAFEHVGYFAWSIVFYYLVGNIYGIAIGYVLSYSVTTIISFIICKYRKNRHLLIKEKIKSNMHMLSIRSRAFIVSCLSAFILMEMDTIMLGAMRNDSTELALYANAKKIISKAPNLNEAIITVLMVDFALLNADNIVRMKKRFKKDFILNGLCTVFVTVMLVVFGQFAIRILYGESFSDSYYYLLILLPDFILTTVNHMFVYFLNYQNQAGYVSASYFVTLVSNLVLNALLIPHYGAVGAGVATCISLVPYFILLLLRVKKVFRLY